MGGVPSSYLNETVYYIFNLVVACKKKLYVVNDNYLVYVLHQNKMF